MSTRLRAHTSHTKCRTTRVEILWIRSGNLFKGACFQTMRMRETTCKSWSKDLRHTSPRFHSHDSQQVSGSARVWLEVAPWVHLARSNYSTEAEHLLIATYWGQRIGTLNCNKISTSKASWSLFASDQPTSTHLCPVTGCGNTKTQIHRNNPNINMSVEKSFCWWPVESIS